MRATTKFGGVRVDREGDFRKNHLIPAWPDTLGSELLLKSRSPRRYLVSIQTDKP